MLLGSFKLLPLLPSAPQDPPAHKPLKQKKKSSQIKFQLNLKKNIIPSFLYIPCFEVKKISGSEKIAPIERKRIRKITALFFSN